MRPTVWREYDVFIPRPVIAKPQCVYTETYRLLEYLYSPLEFFSFQEKKKHWKNDLLLSWIICMDKLHWIPH